MLGLGRVPNSNEVWRHPTVENTCAQQEGEITVAFAAVADQWGAGGGQGPRAPAWAGTLARLFRVLIAQHDQGGPVLAAKPAETRGPTQLAMVATFVV